MSVNACTQIEHQHVMHANCQQDQQMLWSVHFKETRTVGAAHRSGRAERARQIGSVCMHFRQRLQRLRRSVVPQHRAQTRALHSEGTFCVAPRSLLAKNLHPAPSSTIKLHPLPL